MSDTKDTLAGIRKKFSRTAIEQIMKTKTLDADKQRRLWARASAGKRFILTLLAPELLELRARHDALEMFVLDFIEPRLGEETAESLQERLETYRRKALADLPENDQLKHFADPAIQKEIWKGIEDGMKRSVEKSQRKKLLSSAGVEEQ